MVVDEETDFYYKQSKLPKIRSVDTSNQTWGLTGAVWSLKEKYETEKENEEARALSGPLLRS